MTTMHVDYTSDGLGVAGKNLSFMAEPGFLAAYEWSMNFTWNGQACPWRKMDLRWRTHICVWAARHALHLDGAFVECGVDTALYSGAIARHLDFANLPRRFVLFDTFAGIPDVTDMTEAERQMKDSLNTTYYFDCHDFVKEKLRAYPNIDIIRGVLPGTLSAIQDLRIAYLSVDLNNAASEKAVIEALWPQLVPGAVVVIDDYGFTPHARQHDMWDAFATSQDRLIASLPTGQGLLLK